MSNDGNLLILAVLVPVVGVLGAVLVGGTLARAFSLCCLLGGWGVSLAIATRVWQSGAALVQPVGGWLPPLGLTLRADGISAAMLVATATIVLAVGISAWQSFDLQGGKARASSTFWILLPALSAALNAVFLGNDLFNLYVALELLTFAAVPLVCLDGSAATLRAALRYLVFALVGSILYLLGVTLIYGIYGTLDLGQLAVQTRPDMATVTAVALMTCGLLAKTALFPLHLWLPPAHSGAPPAASALLSALVVKGSFFIVVRLWFGGMPWMCETWAAQLLAACGAGAIVFGCLLAMRQERLKLLIAYSTLAQIGYLFLIFPLAPFSSEALNAGMMQAVSHAFAKAAMFLAAGLIVEVLGNDRIDGLGGTARLLPTTTFAFVLAAFSLIGVPPTGGFVAKWILLTAAVEAGQWWLCVAVLVGGLFAGAYLFRVVAAMLEGSDEMPTVRVSRFREAVILALAVIALALGVFSADVTNLLAIAQPSEMGATR